MIQSTAVRECFLVLHSLQAGTTLERVLCPPRAIGTT